MEKTVLIIENDPDTKEVLEYVVTELDINIVSRTTIMPLEELEQLNPSLILLDHWLDDGYGADYCKRVKADEHTRHIPVIIISFIAELKSVSADSNADDCISKPFDIEKLQEMIGRYLVQPTHSNAFSGN